VEQDEGKSSPDQQIEQKGQQSFIGSFQSKNQSLHRTPHRIVVQNHENNFKERSNVILENPILRNRFKNTEKDIQANQDNHHNHSHFVAHFSNEKHNDDIRRHEQNHTSPRKEVRVPGHKRRQGQQPRHVVSHLHFFFAQGVKANIAILRNCVASPLAPLRPLEEKGHEQDEKEDSSECLELAQQSVNSP
jgi:hypothetical protein